MNTRATLFFSARLAARHLAYNKAKTTIAILGVMFACFLIFMQLGFRDSLSASIKLVPQSLNGDLFLINTQTEAIWRTTQLPRNELYALNVSEHVSSIAPVYVGFTKFRNPVDGNDRTVLVWGYDPFERALNFDDLNNRIEGLSQIDTVMFDSLSRPEYGDIKEYIKTGPLSVEIGDHALSVIGTFEFGASFSTEGNVVTSTENFLSVMPHRRESGVDIGIIRLVDGVDIESVKQELNSLLNDDLELITKSEFIERELSYWHGTAPVGFVFGIGAIMGFLVGLVLVYQVLFSEISTNYREYSTLLALGYTFFFLICYISAFSLLVGSLGFIPGYILSYLTYSYTSSVIHIPMPMPPSKVAFVYLIMLVMCGLSSLLAMNKLRSADPADMF